MNCCDYDCNQGRECPARRTLTPEARLALDELHAQLEAEIALTTARLKVAESLLMVMFWGMALWVVLSCVVLLS